MCDYSSGDFGVALSLCPDPCAADVNADGNLNVLDFVAFQLLWLDNDPAADCTDDDTFTVLDFVCYQQLFVGGCP
jgi:hypothetical protein